MTARAEYPTWICSECGSKYGRVIDHCATIHEGDKCGWCDEKTVTTEPRDYGYPPWPVSQK